MTDPTQISELRGAPLAQAVAEYITAHPEEWDQSGWGYKDENCGTTACFAGTAVLLTRTFDWTRYGSLIAIDQRYLSGGWTGDDWTVPEAALELLSLRNSALFYWNPQDEWEMEIGLELEYDEDLGEWVCPDPAPLDFKIRSLWQRVSEEYPGQINIPEEYRV